MKTQKLSEMLRAEAGPNIDHPIWARYLILVKQYEAEQSARDARVLAVIEELHRQALIASRARFALEAALRGEEAPDVAALP